MSISKKEIKQLDSYFRCANYLSVGQLYLLDNPLLKEELKWSDVKKKIVGHWGTVPGQNFIYTHLNRVIKNNDLNMYIYLDQVMEVMPLYQMFILKEHIQMYIKI